MILINEVQFVPRSGNCYVIVNLITGAADIIDRKIYEELILERFNLGKDVISRLLERRYIFSSEVEYHQFLENVNKKIEMLENKSIPNFVLVPSYACNLCCTYCYEQTYNIYESKYKDHLQLIDKQFAFIDSMASSYENPSEIRITIMGGEPLLSQQYNVIEYLINQAKERSFTIDVVTNGVELDSFIPLLNSSTVDHIQVTLDGIEEIHNKRRVFHNGSGSFSKIISNIQLSLQHHIHVYLRVNLDAENIETLPLLAKLLISLESKEYLHPYIYLLQDGGCSGDSNVIRELSGIEQVYVLEKKYPEIGVFSKRYHPMQLIDSIFKDQKFKPCLRHCGAAGNQFILDCNGLIYKCWHGIGNEHYACGKYIPKVEWNNLMEEWANRNVLHLKKCIDCKYRYICGTGCPASKHSGIGCFDISKESCVEYDELIAKLVNIYLDE